MEMILYFGLASISGVLLWHFPFIITLAFCICAGYCLVLYVFQYQGKEAINDSEHSSQRNNYFKLVALIVDVSYIVLWKYIEEQVIGSDNFESYLNTIRAKHSIFHIYKITPCCECKITKIKGEKLISEKQFQMLYKCDENKSLLDHQKYSRGKLSQNCICCYSAVQNVNVRVLDITLSNHLIKRCGKQALGLEVWMRTITKIRNEIFHHSDIQEMTDDKFSRRWQQLEGSIMGIANLISEDFAKDINGKIEKLKQLVVISDQVLQHERLCRDYWKSKCAEFERMQMEEMKANTVDLCQIHPGNTSGSIEMMCGEVFQKIETLNTAVDKILINVFGSDGVTQLFEPQDTPTTEEDQKTVPILFQLEVPTSWNTRKIMKAAEQIRLSGNSDTGLKIKAVSSDDLYIFAEIAKKVLLESEKLSIEINQLMTNILTKAKVKTAERENVNINLRIPKSKDLYVPTSVKIELKKCIPFNTEGLLRNCIIAGNNIVVTKIGKGLRICKIDGTFDRTIKLEKVRYVNRLFLIDCNTIAVSYRLRSVDVLDLSTGLVKNTIELNISNTDYEIAYEDGLMYVVEYGDKFTSDSNEKEKKVIVMNLSGEVIRYIFVSSNRWGNTSISTDSNRLFSISKNNLVYCYDLKGILKWKFQPDKPCYIESIATYEDGQLFVVIKGSILLLSSDGKSLDVVLTLEHSKHISDLYYDKALKLLVYYDTDNLFLYQVKH